MVDDELLTSSEGEDLIDPLTEFARTLAVAAIDQAIAELGPGDPKITEAQEALLDGDTLKDSLLFKDAVNAYKDALAKAEGALP